MTTHPTQVLSAPGVESDKETWLYTDGTDIAFFPLPGATDAVLVSHPDFRHAPAGVSKNNELKSFAAMFFRSVGAID